MLTGIDREEIDKAQETANAVILGAAKALHANRKTELAMALLALQDQGEQQARRLAKVEEALLTLVAQISARTDSIAFPWDIDDETARAWLREWESERVNGPQVVAI
jgi:hypothetical protein